MILSVELLARVHERAPRYDRDNVFFTEDLVELRESGYLRALVPTQFGGLGLTLSAVVHEQARLAASAPATALAINMHLICTGVARLLHDRGDGSLDFVLADAAAGELFAFGISEAGNDLVLFGSSTQARPLPDGGYAFTGTKVFTSLSPAWTRLVTFGLDSVSADAPKLVHAVLARTASGISVVEDWDTVGMRASQSNTTKLDDVVAEPHRVYRRLDPGPSGDALVFAIFANFEILVSAVYAGIADRALALAVADAETRVSARTGGVRALDPAVRWSVADSAMELDGLWPRLENLARDVDRGPGAVDHGDAWFRRLVGLKSAATRTARSVVDRAIGVAGGASYPNTSELGRLYRDVLAGGFHPSNTESAHATVAASVLGPVPVTD